MPPIGSLFSQQAYYTQVFLILQLYFSKMCYNENQFCVKERRPGAVERAHDGTVKSLARDMTVGNIPRQVLSFALPLALGLLFQQLYNTVDSIIVGKFVGKAALASVGSTAPVINTLVGFCAGIGTGASVVVAQYFGAKDHENLHRAVQNTVVLAGLLSVGATALGILLVSPLLRLMRIPEDAFPEAKLYLTIFFSGLTGLLFYNIFAGVLRAVGDSRRPLYFLIVSALTNIVLDLLFVIVFRWGIAGAAFATIVSELISAVLTFGTLLRTKESFGIVLRDVRWDPFMTRRTFNIGLPTGIQQSITSFSNVFVMSYISAFGLDCLSGYSSYNKLDGFLLIPMMSIAQAITTFVGQNFGAMKLDRAREGVRFGLISSIAVTMTFGVLMIVFADRLILLFTTADETEVIRFGVYFIRRCTPFYFLICFMHILAGALRGIGDSRTPMLLMLGSFVAFRQVYLAVTKALGFGLPAVALAFPVGWMLCTVLMLIAYSRSIIVRGLKRSE